MKKVISTNNAPGAIGPYSQAIDTGAFVFASGQIPINPATGEIPAGIEAQTTQAIANVKGILEAAGSHHRQCGKDHCIPGRHGRICRDEQNLCAALHRSTSRPLSSGRKGSPERCARGD